MESDHPSELPKDENEDVLQAASELFIHAAAPIEIIPVDVLSIVFVLAHQMEIAEYEKDCTGMDWYYVTTPMRLSSVCRFWRTVAHDTPRLWSFLQIGPRIPSMTTYTSRPYMDLVPLRKRPENRQAYKNPFWYNFRDAPANVQLKVHTKRIESFLIHNHRLPFRLAIEEQMGPNSSPPERAWMEHLLLLVPADLVSDLILRASRLLGTHPPQLFPNCRAIRFILHPSSLQSRSVVCFNLSNLPALKCLSVVNVLPFFEPIDGFPEDQDGIRHVEISIGAQFSFNIGTVLNRRPFKDIQTLHLRHFFQASSLRSAPFAPNRIPGMECPLLEEILLESISDNAFEYFSICTFPKLSRLILLDMFFFGVSFQDFCLVVGRSLLYLEIRNPPATMRSEWLNIFKTMHLLKEFRVYCDGTSWFNENLLQALDDALGQGDSACLPRLAALRLHVDDARWHDTLHANVMRRNAIGADAIPASMLVLS